MSPFPPSSAHPTAVIGATGQQGGAVVTALLERGLPVRAVIRSPERAAELEARGAGVAVADLRDGDALRRAFDGASSVFAMTTMTGPDGTAGEVADGRSIADAAQATGVPHLVYSSVGGAERGTGIGHFESKWQVEQLLHAAGVPTVVIRPTFFMENLLGFFSPAVEDGTVVLRAPLTRDRPLQMVATRDIGRAAAAAIADPSAVPDGAAEIAGDERTPDDMAAVLGARTGTPARFEPLPIGSLGDEDAEAMFRWFATAPAYDADRALTRALVGDVTDFATFAAEHRLGEGA